MTPQEETKEEIIIKLKMDKEIKQEHERLQGDINSIIKILGAKQELLSLQGQVNYFRKRLMNFCDTLEQEAKLEYTGWYVLLKKDGDGWRCLGTFNPDTCSDAQAEDLEKPEMEWDICLPIPTLETIKEFIGW